MPTPSTEAVPVSTPSVSSSILTRTLHASCPPEEDSPISATVNSGIEAAELEDGVVDKIEDAVMQDAPTSGTTEDQDVVARSPSTSSIDQERMESRPAVSPMTPPKSISPLELRTISPRPFHLPRLSTGSIDIASQSVSLQSKAQYTLS